MIVQVYNDGTETRIFDGNTKLASLGSEKSKNDADILLHRLGLRRRTRWKEATWGYEANIRK